MPFWKKSEDPWDREPEQRPPAGAGVEQEDAPGILDELRDWNAERKERRAREDAPPPPMTCPWCGREMEAGWITAGRDGAQWRPRWPPKLFGRVFVCIDHEGSVLHRRKTAYLCRDCRRMVLEFPAEALEPLEEADLTQPAAGTKEGL